MKQQPHLKKGESVSINISSLGSEGEGVGKVDHLAIFVDGALPGETVTAEITSIKKSFAHAKLLHLEKASESRIPPPCPLFGRCGGCQIMHLAYKKQLEAKQERVTQTLKRVGHLEDIEAQPCLPSPEQFGYRNKISLSLQQEKHQCNIGFCAKKSHHIIDVPRCAIQEKYAQEVLTTLRNLLKQAAIGTKELQQIILKSSVKEQKVLLIFVANGREKKTLQALAKHLLEACPLVKGIVLHPSSTHSYETLAGIPFLEETVMNLSFKISAASFFQVNTSQIENLYKIVLEFAEIDASTTVLDTYCGIGTLSLIAAKHAKKVYGIECVPQAIVDAKNNATLNGMANCEFQCGKTEDLIARFKAVDVVILNPPRQGCDPQVFQAFDKIRPHRIVYVSCDPATLARDLSLLQKMDYTIDRVQPIDMFPQTMHVETVVQLTTKALNAKALIKS